MQKVVGSNPISRFTGNPLPERVSAFPGSATKAALTAPLSKRCPISEHLVPGNDYDAGLASTFSTRLTGGAVHAGHSSVSSQARISEALKVISANGFSNPLRLSILWTFPRSLFENFNQRLVTRRSARVCGIPAWV